MLLSVGCAYSRVTSFAGWEITQKLHGFLHFLVMINLLSVERGIFQDKKILIGKGLDVPRK